MCACQTAIFFFSTGLSGSHDCLSVFMLVYRHACLPLSLSIRLRVFLHVSLPVISLYMLGCLSICLSVFLSTSTSLCINLSTGHIARRVSVFLFASPSAWCLHPPPWLSALSVSRVPFYFLIRLFFPACLTGLTLIRSSSRGL